MRGTLAALVLAALLFGAGGFLLLNAYQNGRSAVISTNQLAAKIKQDFTARNSPLFTLSPEEIRRSRAANELSEPASALPHFQKYPYAEISELFNYSKSCAQIPTLPANSELRKALVWQQFVCKNISSLPPNFFESAPYMHPAGESFVRRAVWLNVDEFKSTEWLLGHLKFAHVLENLCGPDADCQNQLPLKQLTPSASADNLRSILSGDTIAETDKYVLILNRSNQTESYANYLVYSRESWQNYLNGATLRTLPGGSQNCLLQDGQLCWAKNEVKSEKDYAKIVSLLAVGLLILASLLLFQIIRRNISQKRATQRQKFILQMLTHEIRTPATSLTLSLETLRREFDTLPFDSQNAFLRMCDQTQKLSRVIEASKQYLMSDVGANSVQLVAQRVDSINSCLESILERYENRITVTPLVSDRPANIDRYWLELCLTNLVDNALAHGQPPIEVTMRDDEENLILEVKDAGQIWTANLEELALPFKKSNNSQGLGLGLVLVRKIAGAMGGELTVSQRPTIFSLKLKDLT